MRRATTISSVSMVIRVRRLPTFRRLFRPLPAALGVVDSDAVPTPLPDLALSFVSQLAGSWRESRWRIVKIPENL